MLAFEMEKGKTPKKKSKKSKKGSKSNQKSPEELDDYLEGDDPDKFYNPDDIDRYRAREVKLEIKKHKIRSSNSKKLEARVVTLSILPYFVGLLFVSYISVLSFERQNNDIITVIGTSIASTNFRFTKKITSYISDKLMLSMSSQVDGVIELRTYLTSMRTSSGTFVINPENGRYGS